MIDNRLFEKYDGLIFDMDGTLIDTMPVHARAWNMVGEQFGYRFNSQIMYDLGGATVSTIASAIMQDAGMPQERLNEVIQAKRKLSYELIPTESKLLPTFDVVRHYYQQKPIALGSGSNRQIIDMLRYTAKGTGTEVREYLQWFKDHAKADELMISPQAPTFEETVHTMGIIARSMQ